jgi:hypothetical protein
MRHNLSRSLRATEGSAAISMFSTLDEIASVDSLPRNDIAKPHWGEGWVEEKSNFMLSGIP